MRGTVAKRLRRFSKTDLKDQPWVEYNIVRRSPFSQHTTVVLDQGCQKAWYKTLKQIWKMF